MDKESMAAEFTVMHEKCYFCGQDEIVGFREKYLFCPNCGAIYTYPDIQGPHCEHIKYGVPFLAHIRWYGKTITKPYIYEEYEIINSGSSTLTETISRCSVCNKECLVNLD